MKTEYFNRPLYPQYDFDEINRAFSSPQSDNQKKQDNQTQTSTQNGFKNLFSGIGQNGQNPLLSLLLGMKGGNGNMSNVLSSLAGNNPLFEALSSFQSSSKGNKKESECSLKQIPEDEVFF